MKKNKKISLLIAGMIFLAGANLFAIREIDKKLFDAAKSGDFQKVKGLVEEGADVNAKHEYGQVPLVTATIAGYPEIVKFLVEQGANVKGNGKIIGAPLAIAAEKGNLEIVEFLIKKRADVNQKGFFGQTPLHAAVLEGHMLIAKVLIEKGANVNEKTKHNPHLRYFEDTPLHFAAAGGSLPMVKLLVEKGAKIEVKDANRKTPLENAFHNRKHPKIFEFLIEKGAKIDALYFSAFLGKLPLVKFLVEKGMDVNLETERWGRPLEGAVSGGHLPVVKFLVEEGGAKLDIKNKNGETPLDQAREYKQREIVAYLENIENIIREREVKKIIESLTLIPEEFEKIAKKHKEEIEKTLKVKEAIYQEKKTSLPVEELKKLKKEIESLQEKKKKSCTICLGEFDKEEAKDKNIVKTKCGHIFHKKCISKWFGMPGTRIIPTGVDEQEEIIYGEEETGEHKTTCPLCKQNVFESRKK
ncbi:ankyrin repeat domain-containing protein [Candidatus Dependentiae bacterium]